ncbi:unnamed protein product [Lactuca virosa]|uniref:Tudor-knot domain-containing protein n=1 Tax=Lactuca virosa TaxID=75947 RepID=A0AAU9PST3_9ASTR|nr:unnamed protein product [Lactuca virosa]
MGSENDHNMTSPSSTPLKLSLHTKIGTSISFLYEHLRSVKLILLPLLNSLDSDEWKYFVHYLDWNKNWDEWVGVDRLMKYTEENILKQQALDKKHGVHKNSKGRSTQTKPKISNDVKVEKEDLKSSGAKGKKRKSDLSIEAFNITLH